MSKNREGASADDADATYERAVRFLAARSRSVRELRTRLLRAGCVEPHISAAVERLVAVRALDDASYARQVARGGARDKSLSRRGVSSELRRRGVAGPTAESAIADVFSSDEVDEGATAERVARKRMRSLVSRAPRDQQRMLYSYLAARGFPADIIRRVVSSVLRESAAEV